MDFFNSTNLPVPDDQLARNVEAALTTIGSGGGGWGPPGVQYMRIDTQTGAVTPAATAPRCRYRTATLRRWHSCGMASR